MPTTILNLTDLDNLIRHFEQLHHLSSVEMLKDGSARTHIPEDDLLLWEAYVHHRASLREFSERTHNAYLSKLETKSKSKSKSSKHPAPVDELAYAA